jgi:hypothetical protein
MRMRASILTAALLTMMQAATVAAQDTNSPTESDASGEASGDAKTAAATKARVEDPSAFSRPLSLGLLLGYGVDLGNTHNFWGLGLGLRAGYNLRRIYLGGRFVYQFGSSSEDVALGVVIRRFTWRHFDLGFEGGYDLTPIERLTIRPELGLGFVNLTSYSRYTASDTSKSTLEPYFALGATVTYDVTPDFFVGGDTRLQIVLGDAATEAVTFLVHGGMRL